MRAAVNCLRTLDEASACGLLSLSELKISACFWTRNFARRGSIDHFMGLVKFLMLPSYGFQGIVEATEHI